MEWRDLAQITKEVLIEVLVDTEINPDDVRVVEFSAINIKEGVHVSFAGFPRATKALGYTYNTGGFSFTLSSMPHCCGVVISGDVRVWGVLSGKGLGRKLLQARIEIAKRCKYALMMATVRAGNESERHILLTKGFEAQREFANPGTGNEIVLYVKDLANE